MGLEVGYLMGMWRRTDEGVDGDEYAFEMSGG